MTNPSTTSAATTAIPATTSEETNEGIAALPSGAVDVAELRRGLRAVVARCQQVMAHAWMVRTFVKHSTEAEDFPDLMEMVRAVFDTSRALETRIDDPSGYVNMLRKKLAKLRSAADRFRTDAPEASTHTNFQQAVISIDTCTADLTDLLARGLDLVQKIRVAEQPPGTAGASSAKAQLARHASAASATSPTVATAAAATPQKEHSVEGGAGVDGAAGLDDDSDEVQEDGGGPA